MKLLQEAVILAVKANTICSSLSRRIDEWTNYRKLKEDGDLLHICSAVAAHNHAFFFNLLWVENKLPSSEKKPKLLWTTTS